MNLPHILKHIIGNNIPLLYRLYAFIVREGTYSARYCYSVWLRHLVKAYENGLPIKYNTVAELGPGNSLGTGLAAVLCGANNYFALDVVKYTNVKRNLILLYELIDLFKKKEGIPDDNEFPLVQPKLNSYDFPAKILTDELLNKCLTDDRINHIKKSIMNLYDKNSINNDIKIQYFVPWTDSTVIKQNSVDIIFSQAVLEHVNDLQTAYLAMSKWTRPGGILSHEIDFKCHGTASKWNGHLGYSDFLWKIISGMRPYLQNRELLSTHLNLLQTSGFKIYSEETNVDATGIKRDQLSSKFTNIPDRDLHTREAFIQAIKT